MLLTARLIALPATDRCQRRPAPQRSASLWQIPARKQNPWVVRLGNQLKVCGNSLFGPALFSDHAVKDVGFGMVLKEVHLRLDFVRQQIIIGVEKLHPFAAR